MECVIKAGVCKQTLGDINQFLGHRGSIGCISWRMCQHWALSPPFFFLFQENLQLALCVELHPRIQAGQPHRKENSCQTMNYCAVTRQVSLRGVDEEAGSVSRITHTHTPSLVRSCAHIWMQMLVNFTCGEARTKSKAEALLLSGQNTCWCRKPTQHKPTRVEDKHPVFTNTLQSWEEEGKKSQTFLKCYLFFMFFFLFYSG